MSEPRENANPPYGKRGEFRKITVTFPQELYERLVHESARRKVAREPNQLLSSILREAVVKYLEKLN